MQASLKVPLSVPASQALCSQVEFPPQVVEGIGNDFWKTLAAGTKITLSLKEIEWETNSCFKNNIYSKSFFPVLKFLFYRQTKLLMMWLKCWIWQQCESRARSCNSFKYPVMILWCPLDIKFDINSPAEIYEICAKKSIFLAPLIYRHYYFNRI